MCRGSAGVLVQAFAQGTLPPLTVETAAPKKAKASPKKAAPRRRSEPRRSNGADGRQGEERGRIQDACRYQRRDPQRHRNLRQGRCRRRVAVDAWHVHARPAGRGLGCQHPRLRGVGPRQHDDRRRAAELQVHRSRGAGLPVRRSGAARRHRRFARRRVDRRRRRRPGGTRPTRARSMWRTSSRRARRQAC